LKQIKTLNDLSKLTYQICEGLEQLVEPLSIVEETEEISQIKATVRKLLTTFYTENGNRKVLDVLAINKLFLLESFKEDVLDLTQLCYEGLTSETKCAVSKAAL
jgi:hypothetical protein